MAKTVHDSVLDGAFDILDQATGMHVCDTQPTTRTEAVTTYQLASAVMTPDTDFTKGEGDADGRKVTVAEKLAVDIDNSGDAIFIALTDGANLLYVTTCTLQTLTQGGTVDIPAWDIEIADPT